MSSTMGSYAVVLGLSSSQHGANVNKSEVTDLSSHSWSETENQLNNINILRL